MSFRSQRRKRTSRGSTSLLSIDLWRTFGRGRSRSDSDSKAYSSASCDPSRQETVLIQQNVKSDYPTSAQVSGSASSHNPYLRSTAKSPLVESPDELLRFKKSRALSWFSFSRYKSTRSTIIDPSMHEDQQVRGSPISWSTSNISTPILISTTNAQVATFESVKYDDVLISHYPSMCSSPAEDFDTRVSSGHSIPHSFMHPWSSTVRGVKKKLAHKRRASTSLLIETSGTRELNREKCSTANTSAIASTVRSCKDLSYQRAGRELIPSSHETRDSASISRGDINARVNKRRNHSTPDLRLAPSLPGLYWDGNLDLPAPSLLKSFSSTVDKLDFDSSPTLVYENTPVSRLRKAKSYLSLHKYTRENSSQALNTAVSPPDLITQGELSERVTALPICSLGNKQSLKEGFTKPNIRVSRPLQLRFSGQKRQYVPSEPESKSPKGVNPLRMHPEATAFANVVGPETPGQNSSISRSAEYGIERQSKSIDRAILYSPSTGNLSVYSRTPSPKVYRTVLRERSPQETPTRKPLHRASGSMLKKSVSNLLGKSASMIKATGFTPMKQVSVQKSVPTECRHANWPNSQVEEEIAEAKTAEDQTAAADTHQRSMSTPEMRSRGGTRAAWDHQPLSPSPLRESTKISTTSKNRQRSVTTNTPIKVPVGGLMLSRARSSASVPDPEKRFGKFLER